MNDRILVMNIKREFFAAILSISKRKKIEYRDLSSYWARRLERVGPTPFNLRFLNGMRPPVPEATVRVESVVFDRKNKTIELHLGRIIEVKHWDRRAEQPA